MRFQTNSTTIATTMAKVSVMLLTLPALHAQLLFPAGVEAGQHNPLEP